MSIVNGYKITEIKTKESESFNMRNSIIFDHLMLFQEGLDENSGGIAKVYHEEAVELYEKLKNDEVSALYSDDEKKEAKEMVKKIIEDSKEDGFAEYYCY
ncbi:MAG: hypothetical protein ACOCRX_04605 [Candidatus Woesearchaeota archaeon]